MVAAPRTHRTSQAIRAAVRDYFTLLQAQLRGRRWWLSRDPGAFWNHFVDDHDDQSDLWHGQISAILISHGLPYLTRARPRPNTDAALPELVRTYLYNHPIVLELMEHDVFRSVDHVPMVEDHERVSVPPPAGDEIPVASGQEQAQLIAGVDFLEREQRNHSLATAGQRFVMSFEAARLRANERAAFADGIEHVMADDGDGPGYAIHSYGLDGSDRFIEVKTTCYGRETPFYVSAHEVAISRHYGSRFWVYRVFGFRTQPMLYILQGPLDETVSLEPTEYRASPNQGNPGG